MVVAALAGAVWLATALVRRWLKARWERLAGEPLLAAAELDPEGRPLVVAFSTRHCGVCHFAQKPALTRLAQLAQGVTVVEIDAGERPEVARAFGVLTVPTTVVFSASGKLLAANQGYATAETLLSQLAVP